MAFGVIKLLQETGIIPLNNIKPDGLYSTVKKVERFLGYFL